MSLASANCRRRCCAKPILRCARHVSVAAVLIFGLFVASTATNAASGRLYNTGGVQPFKLTDIDGSFSVRFMLDDRDDSGPSSGSSQDRVTWEQELFVGTDSYVYHPGFLNMRIGGGPLLVQQTIGNDVASNSNDEILFNFVAALNFLSIKPYPFTLQYSRTHPAVSTSLAGRFLTRNTQYGVNGSLSELILPFRVTYGLQSRQTKGSGLGTIVDTDVDDITFGAFKSYGRQNDVRVVFNSLEQFSSSGSPSLPTQTSRIERDIVGVVATNRFGAEKQIRLNQSVDIRQEKSWFESRQSGFDSEQYAGNLSWQHNQKLSTYYRFGQNRIDRDGVTQKGRNGSAVASLRMGNLTYGLRARAGSNSNLGFEQDSYNVGGSFSYSRNTSFGSVRLGAGLNVGETSQESEIATIRVIDENVVLISTEPATLQNEFIVNETIIVRNETKTRTYIGGIDYRLVIIGSSTSIQRLPGGEIIDGEIVLVEYEFESGGTVDYESVGQNYSASIDFLEHYSAYVSLGISENEIIRGEPTISLNSRRGVNAGVQANYDISNSWQLGGHIRFTEQNEDISPFSRIEFSAHAARQVGPSTRVSLSAGYVEVDNENSPEDVRAERYGIGVTGRLPLNIIFNYGGTYTRDTGGTIHRSGQSHRLTAQWNYRRMRVALTAQLRDEQFGVTQRRNFNVQAQLQRSF